MSAITVMIQPPGAPEPHAQGAWEGASQTSRELASHQPPIRSVDADLLPDKEIIDARSRDNVRNSGWLAGAVTTHKDSIVGSQFLLNAMPRYKYLGGDEKWAEEMQEWAELTFGLYAESPSMWLDASRHETLTGLVRQGVVGMFTSGEEIAVAEWIRDPDRPYKTAVQRIDPDRLSNPRNTMDTDFLRRGVEFDRYGAPIAYHFMNQHPYDYFNRGPVEWRRVPARKPWGRIQVIHLFEGFRPDQSRGVAEMAAVLKQIRMTSRFQDVTLQNAVVQATYAATIESELPREVLMQQIGAESPQTSAYANAVQYLQALTQYGEGAKNVRLDGVKIPTLFPGSKLHLQPAGTAGGVGTTFEESLLRHIASALGVSYEQLSHDYSKTNYSSARATMNETFKNMQSKKKIGADRFGGHCYALWLEEEWNRPRSESSMPRLNKWSPDFFYERMNKEAFTACSFIGSSRGQIDEMKETQAAVMRIQNGLSTLELECSKLGLDYREVLRQISREMKLKKQLGLDEVILMNAMAGAKKEDDSEEKENAK